MPIITPEIGHEEKSRVGCNSASLNTADFILQSSLQLYESEFERAYKIMRKIAKGKMQMEDFFSPYECFMRSDGTIIPDTGYHFVIVIHITT
jgi:hypothetical protein